MRRLPSAAAHDPQALCLQLAPTRRPDFGACQQLAAEVVAADAPCSAPPCALGTPQVCRLSPACNGGCAQLGFPWYSLQLHGPCGCLNSPSLAAYHLQRKPLSGSTCQRQRTACCCAISVLPRSPPPRATALSPSPASLSSTSSSACPQPRAWRRWNRWVGRRMGRAVCAWGVGWHCTSSACPGMARWSGCGPCSVAAVLPHCSVQCMQMSRGLPRYHRLPDAILHFCCSAPHPHGHCPNPRPLALQAGEEFCGKSWAQVQAERPGELMLEDYCFRYVLKLFVM